MAKTDTHRPTRIAVFTGARSDYGPLRWVLEDLRADPGFDLRLIVGASHFDPAYGSTWKAIEADGFGIAARLEMNLSSGTRLGIAKSTGIGMMAAAEAFDRLEPELLLVLGDRTELLSVCPAALIQGIPIAHVSGGDITEGAIDDSVRHAVSKMASVHFPGTEASREILLRLGESPDSIHCVGEPSLDNFRRLGLQERGTLFAWLGADPARDTALFTFHPETATGADAGAQTRILLDALEKTGIQVVMTYPNADAGSAEIIAALRERRGRLPDRFFLVDNLGQERYLSLLRQVRFMIGNSSSGLIESPSVPCWNIDVGNRQKGRLSAANTLRVPCEAAAIAKAIAGCLAAPADALDGITNPYGDGRSAERSWRYCVVPAWGRGPKRFHRYP